MVGMVNSRATSQLLVKSCRSNELAHIVLFVRDKKPLDSGHGSERRLRYLVVQNVSGTLSDMFTVSNHQIEAMVMTEGGSHNKHVEKLVAVEL